MVQVSSTVLQLLFYLFCNCMTSCWFLLLFLISFWDSIHNKYSFCQIVKFINKKSTNFYHLYLCYGLIYPLLFLSISKNWYSVNKGLLYSINIQLTYFTIIYSTKLEYIKVWKLYLIIFINWSYYWSFTAIHNS